MLLRRLAVAAVFIPIIIFLILRGGILFLTFVCCVIGIGMLEFYQSEGADSSYICFRDIFLSLFIPVAVYFRGEKILPFIITLIIFIVFFWEIFKLRVCNAQINIALSIGAILYISYLFSYTLIIRGIPKVGARLTITIFFVTWMADTGAFTVGKLLGKHRFFPEYSPHKSVEGFLGAIGFSLIATMVSSFWISLPFLHLVVLGFLIGAIGEIGDLFESMLKRSIGIKDFGKILPGHGGIIDRFDSLFFTSPIFFYYLKYLVGFGRIG